jgi:type I site-specific restriction-modification system R (restriction) subunit
VPDRNVSYLIQHSAGSGKTNSIAWSAHFLADLHDAQHKKVFDSVLVVSDRNIIDQQLQEAKPDAEGHYDDFEVDRVIAGELNPNFKQSDLIAALEPVRVRLLRRYEAAQETLQIANAKQEDKALKGPFIVALH